MPVKPKKPCSYPGCPKLTDGGRCEKHKKQQRRADDEKRGTAVERGYDATWAKIRIIKLNNDPLCERCQAKGIDRAAVLVHHKDRDPKNNRVENHESLCDQCHDEEHRDDIFRRR